MIDSPVDVYESRAPFCAVFFCKTLQRYYTKLLKLVSGEKKVINSLYTLHLTFRLINVSYAFGE